MVTTQERTGATTLVQQLESYGVEFVFGLCGHTNIAALNALESSSITFLTARHEQVATHMADGYARLSGKAGVALLHVGPGLTNACTGVATAWADSIPLVVICGDVPSYYHGRGPHQEINLRRDDDQRSVFEPFVKRSWNVGRVEDLPRFLERAFWTATSGRPGPVLVNVPMDMFSRPYDGESDYPLPGETAAPALPSEAAERIVAELAAARQPLVYVGGGLRSPRAREALLRLVERLELPVAHSLMGKGTIADAHPLLVGMLGFWGTEYGNDYARNADLILALGTRFAETDANSWDPRFGVRVPPTRLFQIDIDAAEIGRNYPVEFGAVASLEQALPELWRAAERLGATPVERAPQRDAIAAARSEVWARMAERGALDDFPLAPERILEDLRRHLPAETVLVTDVGWNKNGVAQCYQLPEAGRFVTPGGFSTMGYGPAAAIGAKIASPERPIVALIGDGAMSNQLSAIVTAAEHRVGVVWVVMNNAAFGTIAGLQESHYGTDYGCVFLDAATGEPYTPDFAGIARSCGVQGIRVGAADELVPALEEALASGGPALIDVPMLNDPVPTPGHWNINDIYQGVF